MYKEHDCIDFSHRMQDAHNHVNYHCVYARMVHDHLDF